MIFTQILEFWGINSSKCKLIIIANKIILDAKVCVIKYLIDASEGNKLFLLFIRGIIERRLISNPIHIENHDNDEIVKRVPKIIELKNKIL